MLYLDQTQAPFAERLYTDIIDRVNKLLANDDACTKVFLEVVNKFRNDTSGSPLITREALLTMRNFYKSRICVFLNDKYEQSNKVMITRRNDNSIEIFMCKIRHAITSFRSAARQIYAMICLLKEVGNFLTPVFNHAVQNRYSRYTSESEISPKQVGKFKREETTSLVEASNSLFSAGDCSLEVEFSLFNAFVIWHKDMLLTWVHIHNKEQVAMERGNYSIRYVSQLKAENFLSLLNEFTTTNIFNPELFNCLHFSNLQEVTPLPTDYENHAEIRVELALKLSHVEDFKASVSDTKDEDFVTQLKNKLKRCVVD